MGSPEGAAGAQAAQCAQWKLDAHALMAALLHDAMEDCGVSKGELIKQFGAPVAELVDGLTKLESLQFQTREEKQAESFRKMLLVMARDVRVILIKLADRLHNMRTLEDLKPEKRARIASETLEVYAPIAHRLGLNQIYRELQDLSFRHKLPWRYKVLTKRVVESRKKRRDLVQRVQREVEAAFSSAGLPVRVYGREKALYSIYRKMDEKHLHFDQVTDLFGFRVIVPSTAECYTSLGVLHELYKPVPGKFKDHIAIPKVNGYQSLHTIVRGPGNINVELQVRTDAMNVVAESGVAAHWMYKANAPDSDTAGQVGVKWLQSLLDINNETGDAAEFWEHVKIDLFPDAIYVFTPRSEIKALPRGATVIDFAYAIHSDVGSHTVGGKINGQPVALRTQLKNGDVVEVSTEPDSRPNPAWLEFVRSARARSKIRHHLKTIAQVESQEFGRKLLAQALRGEGFGSLPDDAGGHLAIWDRLMHFSGNRSKAELLIDLGLGKRVAGIVAKRLAKMLVESGERPDPLLISSEHLGVNEGVSQGSIALDGGENASLSYSTCCRPVPGDAILGYMGRGEGLIVHAANCSVAKRLLHRDPARFIEVEWADELVRTFEVGVVVSVVNGKGVLARVTAAIADSEADINHVQMDDAAAQNTTDLRFVIAVRDRVQLDLVLRNLRRTPSVIRAERQQSVG